MRYFFALVAVLAAGLASAEDRYLTGSVTYREKIALSERAVVRVVVEDVSVADRGAPLIAQATIEPKGRQVPFAFSIKFESSQVLDGNQYGVRAQISEGGRLLFTSTLAYPVRLDGTDGPVQITVAKVAGVATSVLEDTKWALYELSGSRSLEAGSRELGINFEGRERFGAYAGVNSIGGSYSLDGFKIKFTDVVSTMMAGPEPLMRQERSFLDMLGKANKAKVFGEHLVLYASDRTLAKLRRSEAD